MPFTEQPGSRARHSGMGCMEGKPAPASISISFAVSLNRNFMDTLNSLPTLPASDYQVRKKSISVLLADERTIMRKGIEALLEGCGDIDVLGHIPDQSEFLERIDAVQPDVVIVAFKMVLGVGLGEIRRSVAFNRGTRVLVLVPEDDAFLERVPDFEAVSCIAERACSRLLVDAVRKVRERKCPLRRVNRSMDTTCTETRPKAAAPDEETVQLTLRELEVLRLVAVGNANKQMASTLGLSIRTIEKHRQHLMEKLGINNTATLTRYALYVGVAQ